jgi:hypothetical protein
MNAGSKMQPKATLIVADETRGTREVPILSSRFTIGRGSENDLVIDDVALSRRHAVIEIANGVVQVSDCGSLNGTFVNSTRVTAPTIVTDRDVISIGEIYPITLCTGDRRGEDADRRCSDQQSKSISAIRKAGPDWKNRPTIALVAIAAILLVAGTLVGLLRIKSSPSDIPVSDAAGQESEESAELRPRDPAEATGARRSGVGNPASVSAERIENEAVQVLLRATTDRQRYEFPPEVLSQIKERVEAYSRATDLQPALRSMARDRRAIADEVRARGQGLEPYFVAYAALAQTDGGRLGSDYVRVVRQTMPVLVTLGIHLGTDADSSLIVLAAQTLGPGTKKTHPLLPRIRQIIENNPSKKRNFWYLYEQNGLSNEAYSFVIRFLALGIIAQNPRQFGIEAEPLTF